MLANESAEPGDVLFLTKPLGSGVLTTAIKRQLLTRDEIREVTEVMATLNAVASNAARRAGAHACTDITGFGLIGHLRGMLKGRRLGVRLDFSALPVMSRVVDLLCEGVYPGGTQKNLEYFGDRLTLAPGLPAHAPLLLADPQTSGGLLIAVPRGQSDDLAAALAELGTRGWARIGAVEEDPTESIAVEA